MMTALVYSHIQFMKRFVFAFGFPVVLLSLARLSAQESAVGGEAGGPTPPAGANPHPGLLAPATTTTTTTTVVKSAPAQMSQREIERVQQQEIIRRQELVFKANQALAAGHTAELAGDYPEARKNDLFAAEAYGSISRSTNSYAKAAEGLTRVDLQLYDAALKRGDMVRAKMLVDEVVKYNPNNQFALEKQAAINRALANPNDTTLLGNPAITPRFINKVNEVEQLFAEAEQFRRTGQWDEAVARLKRILGIDPYNIAATKQLERIDKEKNEYADKARIETRDERLRQVQEKWYEPINNKDVNTLAQESQPSIVRATNFDLDQKLKSIFLSVDLNNNTIEEAANILSIESKRLDTQDHKGINFIIDPNAATSAKPISITLNNVPLGEVLRYVCQIAGVKYKVQDYAISIVPFNANVDELISKTFNVQPNFVAPPSTNPIDSAAAGFGARRPPPVTPAAGGQPDEGAGDTVRAALEAKGVKFAPGGSAVYNPGTGQLTIIDTADQMDLIEELVNAGQAPTLMVRIATKFVEINQDDLNDLTVNTAAAFLTNELPHNHNTFTTSFNTALPGSAGFSSNSIDQLINPQGASPGFISIHGFISYVSYNAILTALSKKKSFDLLSEPAVLTKSGETGTLEAVRVFPYPVAFDPPEMVQINNNNNNGGAIVVAQNPPTVIPTTPTDFKRRNVGVRLVIKPQVVADNKTVDLSLFPEVTDFEGFINYGSPIIVANPIGLNIFTGVDTTGLIDKTSLLSTNEINQPVFNTRRINTKVLIRDGSTVVLGGLIREDLQNINDKVPFLGDLPLIGRLFQSKAVKSTKRNLLIFVTANIYRNDGELLNPPELANATDVLLGHASYAPPARP